MDCSKTSFALLGTVVQLTEQNCLLQECTLTLWYFHIWYLARMSKKLRFLLLTKVEFVTEEYNNEVL